jgi:hypothetical protein
MARRRAQVDEIVRGRRWHAACFRGRMLPRPLGPASRALSAALFTALALVALPHCANGDGGETAAALPGEDGQPGKLESPATSKSPTEPEPTSTSSATTSSPSDAGTVVVPDAAAADAGCKGSSECAAVSCKCKIGGITVEGRLCSAGACVTAQKDVCPTSCGLLGGWSGT